MLFSNSGLVLEGGGMRGVFTAGVLDYFLDYDLFFDNCLAVSAGSCHACSYLAKQRDRAIRTSIDYVGDKRYCSLYSLFTTGDLFGAEMLYEIMPQELYPLDWQAFSQDKTRFQAVVTNCLTGEAEYPDVTDLRDLQCVRASSSLPFVSRMVMINGTPYLDGGISDSLPIRQSLKQGNEKNVLVLTRPRDYRKEPSKFAWLAKIRYHKYPKLVEKINNRYLNYNQTLDFVYEQEALGNLFIIQPEIALEVGRIEKDVDKLQKAYEIGYASAEKQYNDLLEYLK